MIEILLVEDDPVLGKVTQVNLEAEGYKVHWVNDVKSAIQANATQKLNLVILDLGLPDGSGFQFLDEVKKGESRIPVIILTARTDVDSVVEGLQRGATDYLRKPVADRELLARIKTTLREPVHRERQVRYGDLLLLLDKRLLKFGDKDVELTPREFDTLSYLLQHAEQVISRDRLLQALYQNGELYDRTIDSHVSHVRAALRRAGVRGIRITSIYGVGYRLESR